MEVQNFPWLPGPASLWASRWFLMPGVHITAADVGAWPVTFWSRSLALWRSEVFTGLLTLEISDLGCVVRLDLLILYGLWSNVMMWVDPH